MMHFTVALDLVGQLAARSLLGVPPVVTIVVAPASTAAPAAAPATPAAAKTQ